MARRKLTEHPTQEPRGSKDPRVQFVPVPNARRLIVGDADDFKATVKQGDIVWLRLSPGDEGLETFVQVLTDAGAIVRVLPRDTEDADLPAAAGTAAPTSDVSEVRPVVAELVSELPEELRGDVAAFVERELSEAGL